MNTIDPVSYILILYGMFLAVTLIFFILFVMFKTSEREKDEIFKEVMKRKAREFVWERAHGVRCEAAPTITM